MEFSKTSQFPVNVEALFDWHERPGAFQRLAPPWQSVRLLKHVGGIQDGAQVDVETRVGGIPQTWKMRHCEYVYAKQFVDVMHSGPFKAWRHEHRFSAVGDGCSELTDHLSIEPLGGALGGRLQSGFLKGELTQVFNYRHSLFLEDMKRAQRLGPPALSGKVLITGVSGMIGRALAAYLQTRDYAVVGVSRSGRSPWPGVEVVKWDPEQLSITSGALSDVEAVINLAGESILGPWTHKKMEAIQKSREDAAQTLITGFEAAGVWPKVWVNASGTGFYGPQPGQAVDESSASGAGFLAHVCRAWEGVLEPVRKHSRVISARLGTVMSPAGGALSMMLPIFKMGGGGVLGNPKAVMPWIALDDAVYALEHLLYEPVSGPVNFVSPEVLTQAELAKTLARVLRRPSWLPAPAGVLKTLLGSMAKEIFLIDQQVSPKVLEDTGFVYSKANFEAMLKHSLGLVA